MANQAKKTAAKGAVPEATNEQLESTEGQAGAGAVEAPAGDDQATAAVDAAAVDGGSAEPAPEAPVAEGDEAKAGASVTASVAPEQDAAAVAPAFPAKMKLTNHTPSGRVIGGVYIAGSSAETIEVKDQDELTRLQSDVHQLVHLLDEFQKPADKPLPIRIEPV